MGWYAAWRLMAEHGGPEKVPAEAKRRCLGGEADPVRTWDVAEQPWTGEWDGTPLRPEADDGWPRSGLVHAGEALLLGLRPDVRATHDLWGPRRADD